MAELKDIKATGANQPKQHSLFTIMHLPCTVAAALLLFSGISSGYTIKPFNIDLSSRVGHMKDLIGRTQLPNYSVLGDAGAGIKLPWLQDRQKEWLTTFDWKAEQKEMNQFNHSTVDIGNLTIHFIHQRSSDPKAIPLLLTHGWPGSFYEFNQVIFPLSNPGQQSNVSFHVIVPSLPGYGFSSPAPVGWTINNTADAFDTLLIDALGYKSYVAAGGDLGAGVTWALHNNHADHTKAVLYTGLIPQLAPQIDQLLNDPRFANQTKALSDEDKERILDNVIFPTVGSGYLIEQSTRPATIGLALYDNPIGQLAWMGERFLYGDPLIGTSPSTLNNNTILTSVSLYHLSRTFETSVNIYYQNPAGPAEPAATDVPMGFAGYRYEIQYYPEFYMKEIGNLVYYADHPRGGHFSALDNPPAYVDDLRTMMGRWYSV